MHARYGPYLVYVATVIAGLMAFVAAGNVVVDPYFVFGRPSVRGFNETRIDAVDYPALSKLHSVDNHRPRTLIFGSSLAQIGLNPEHSGFLTRPVYNLGMPGASMFMALRYFQHVLATGNPQQVILAADFLQFDTRGPRDRAGLERLAVTADGLPTSTIRLWQQRLADFRFAALSSNATYSSWRTVAENLGFGRRMRWITLANGRSVLLHRVPFDMHSQFVTTRRGFLRHILSPRFCLTHSESGYSQLDDFRRFVRAAREHGLDLRILISPSHAGIWEAIAQAGLWEKWEKWKRQLTTIVFEETGSDNPFPLWDFSGYHQFSTWPVPPPGSLEPMRWYADVLHYTDELGYLVLDTVLGNIDPPPELPPNLGIRLTPATVEAQLARIRADRRQWRMKFPEHAAQVEGFANEIPDIRIKNASCE